MLTCQSRRCSLFAGCLSPTRQWMQPLCFSELPLWNRCVSSAPDCQPNWHIHTLYTLLYLPVTAYTHMHTVQVDMSVSFHTESYPHSYTYGLWIDTYQYPRILYIGIFVYSCIPGHTHPSPTVLPEFSINLAKLVYNYYLLQWRSFMPRQKAGHH